MPRSSHKSAASLAMIAEKAGVSPKTAPLISEILQKAGYHTLFVGRWHNEGHPALGKGFDRARRAMYQDSLNDYARYGHSLLFRSNFRLETTSSLPALLTVSGSNSQLSSKP